MYRDWPAVFKVGCLKFGYWVNSEEKEYTARELMKIFGVTQQTIINRCKAGHFAGAVKRKSPYGEQWFIPKDALNTVAQEIVPW